MDQKALNMATSTDIVGLLGGITIAVSLLPQVHKTWRTESASDISYTYQAIYILGCTMTNAYAIIGGLWPVFVPCLFEETLIIILTIMKFVYDDRERKKGSQQEQEIEMPSFEVVDAANHDVKQPGKKPKLLSKSTTLATDVDVTESESVSDVEQGRFEL